MWLRIAQRQCNRCDRLVLGLRERPNHLLHLLLSLATAGVWLIVWAIIGFSYADEPWHCPYCGSLTVEPGYTEGNEGARSHLGDQGQTEE